MPLPYDRVVDPLAARAALNLDPARQLTRDVVETAYRNALWAHHPSRYPDATSRRTAEGWAMTLGEAHAALLAETDAGAVAVAASHPSTPDLRRGLTKGWIAGIAAGASLLVIGVIVALAFGVSALSQRVAELAEPQLDVVPTDDSVEQYSSAETLFNFPSSLEYYSDGRLADQCPAEHEQGCWEAAITPENDCAIMTVSIGYATTLEQQTTDYIESLRFYDTVAGETIPVVFGNDDYPYAWVLDVACHDQPE